ncbi:ankyrin repeat-containing protein ITN1-like [Senna tora]|uniref:Ankyrin repeat-containing protein ITN1-like n=1 Tax=Senna tora TaxID=362788 RepID=A0A834XBL5_9FABA|nr:ankyrin repeat-containing protein ITN1-like [Senna tora]
MEEKKEIGIMGMTPRFSERIQRAQNHYYSENWSAFKKVFEEDKKDLLEEFDLFGNTAIHVATHSNNPLLLKHLLQMLLPEDRWNALRKKNCQSNTILHEIAMQDEVEMVDVVLEFDRKDIVEAPPPPEEEMSSLLKTKNQKGETPLFRAAKFGKLKMVKQMVKYVDDEGDMEVHLHSKNQNILHACVLGCFFVLPEERYEILEGYNNTFDLFPHKRDLESGHQDDAKPPTSGLSKINYALWNCLAKVSNRVDDLWRRKNKYELAKRLAESLVIQDYSWQTSHNHLLGKARIKLPPILYNVSKRKEQYEREKKMQHQLEDEKKKKKQLLKGPAHHHEDHIGKAKKYFHYAPLLIAASYGIIEIVELFLKKHPESINHVSDDGHNVLHMAVKHRQLKIFKLLQKKSEFHTLASQISSKTKNTILHQVARTDFYRPPELPGAAFQLQSELKWFKRVRKVLPSHLIMHCDEDYLTAADILDIMHYNMLKEAQSWIKETSQSCSTVSVLVATVVFAAAYTIPGGSTEGGDAVLSGSPVLLFFTTMDIVALSLSLASVVMFLSILSAPFELWDFHKSLPIRLRIGFAFLFGSLTTTMLAFIATVLITIKLQWKNWASTLIYGVAFFPVTIFALMEFPLYTKLPNLLMKMCRKVMKMVGIYKVVRSFSGKRLVKRKYP